MRNRLIPFLIQRPPPMDHGSGKSPMDEKVKKLLRYCQKKAEEVLWLFFPKTLICRGRGKKKNRWNAKNLPKYYKF